MIDFFIQSFSNNSQSGYIYACYNSIELDLWGFKAKEFSNLYRSLCDSINQIKEIDFYCIENSKNKFKVEGIVFNKNQFWVTVSYLCQTSLLSKPSNESNNNYLRLGSIEDLLIDYDYYINKRIIINLKEREHFYFVLNEKSFYIFKCGSMINFLFDKFNNNDFKKLYLFMNNNYNPQKNFIQFYCLVTDKDLYGKRPITLEAERVSYY